MGWVTWYPADYNTTNKSLVRPRLTSREVLFNDLLLCLIKRVREAFQGKHTEDIVPELWSFIWPRSISAVSQRWDSSCWRISWLDIYKTGKLQRSLRLVKRGSITTLVSRLQAIHLILCDHASETLGFINWPEASYGRPKMVVDSLDLVLKAADFAARAAPVFP